MASGEHLGDDLDLIACRARRRQLALVAFTIGAGVLGGIVGAVIGGARHSQRHHNPVWVSILFIGLGVALIAGVALAMWQWRRLGHLFEPQLIMGLPRKQRRTVLRDLRRGQPSGDLTLRRVEESLAQRTVSHQMWVYVLFGVLTVDEIVQLAASHSTASRVFFGVAIVLFAVGAILQRQRVAHARRYLTHVA